MGRYQQWLHYRQVELLLQEELAQLEDEIARLLTAMQSLDAVNCLSQNPIIAALAATLVDHEPAALTALAELEQSSVETPTLPAITAPLSITPAPDEQSASGVAPPVTISPALRSWGDLPDFYGASPDALCSSGASLSLRGAVMAGNAGVSTEDCSSSARAVRAAGS